VAWETLISPFSEVKEILIGLVRSLGLEVSRNVRDQRSQEVVTAIVLFPHSVVVEVILTLTAVAP
jgi:hypothetical protein